MRFMLKDRSWKLKISESEHLTNHIQRSICWKQMSLLDTWLTNQLVLGTAIILNDTNFV